MSVQQLLAKLRALDVNLWVEGGKLRYSAPKGALTDELLQELASRKPEVMEWLEKAVPAGRTAVPDIVPVSRSRDLPPSYAQERLLFIDQLIPDLNSYNVPLIARLHGELDIPALEQALNELISRHEALRTRFDKRGGRHYQVVEPDLAITIEVVALSRDEDVMRRVNEEIFRPFDLSTGPLVRCRLFRFDDMESVLTITLHHIVCDGWSLGVMLGELGTCYTAFHENRPVRLPELPVQYADYAVWQRETLDGALLNEHLAYWRSALQDLSTLDLPLDHPRPAIQQFQGGVINRRLSRELSRRFKALSESGGVTIFMTLLSAFTVLLHRYCNQDDIVVGTPIANRNRVEIENLIGFFINMLVLRTDTSGRPTFRELLSRVKKAALDAYQHQELPFEKLVNELHTERDLSRNPLFQVSFALQNAPLSTVKLGDLDIEPLSLDEATTRFDIEVNFWESDEGLKLICSYNSGLFERATIERLLTHYERLLEAVANDPDCSIDALDILGEEEKRRILLDWNRTAAEYPRHRTVHELFEEQTEKTPDRSAFEYRDAACSYRELNARANRLANYLKQQGVGPGTMVGLCLERGLDMLVALLGIVKAGGTYVPLDPEYPEHRIEFMIEDAGITRLVTLSSLQEHLKSYQGDTVLLDSDADAIAQQSEENPPCELTPDSTLYMIYTSGSTGRPKGVPVPHRAVVCLVRNADYVQVQPEDRLVPASNISFDAATFEVWGALLNGAQLCGVDREVLLDPAAYSGFIQQQGITVLFLTTALFNLIARQEPNAFRNVRTLLFGGEAVDPRWVRRVLQSGPPQELLHMYGPTENTTFSTWYRIDDVAEDAVTVPIGRPMANSTAYILDRSMNPVPIGVTGELYLGGDGLAQGYLNRPELTSEKFVPDPFGDDRDARLYRTGDLVRTREDGAIEFVGRVDHQVKIRGFRIEPGEVESVLCRQPAVETAAVLALDDEDGAKRLVAYVVLAAADTGVDELRTALHEELPAYMVPTAFILLDELPLTPNGKLDRDALPAPDAEHIARTGYVAPRSGLEKGIAQIWCDLLGTDKAGLRDNFFDLGGHSLLMSQVQARLNEYVGRNVPMLDLFQYPTIESLARHLSGEEEKHASAKNTRRVRRARAEAGEAVAVIAMAGRFPGAANIEQFWDNLANGVESIRFFTDEELIDAGVPEAFLRDERYIPAKGYLEDADQFDAAFFGYPPREAELIDPQQRLFLECAVEVLERAGYDPARYGGAIGVYAGSSTTEYRQNIYSHPELAGVGMQAFISSDKDFLPTRTSYKLNLRGPSVTVQTACSTSLVAIHEACRSLREDECDIALAGGVSVMSTRKHGYFYEDESIMSPDGHCRAFSNDARGTVSGEGVGIVALKRLSDAIRDRDRVLAVLRGTAINNDGSNKVGYTAPSVEGQSEVITMAQAAAEVSADSISYIETHGTGTTLGDPIEIAALIRAFRENGDNGSASCAIGSVKTNIGHLDAAAGVTGVIKTVLAMQHRQIPPSLHYRAPNPEIDFNDGPFFVNASLQPWEPAEGAPRRAGVSSFGIGGTNAHAILEQAPPAVASEPAREWQMLPLSANNQRALDEYAQRLADYLEQHTDTNLADVSCTLRTGRSEHDLRRAVICADIDSAVSALRGEIPGRFWSSADVSTAPPVIFMFPGQGAQYAEMGRGLYESETLFRTIVDECSEQLVKYGGPDVRGLLYSGDAAAAENDARALRSTSAAQCALFVIEYALARLWMSWGVQPAALIGHSIGEYVAACISGVFELDEALQLIAARALAMEQAPSGAMLAVPLAEVKVRDYLEGDLWLSVVNGHQRCVISGTKSAIDALEQRLRASEVASTRLHTAGAFHSGLMDEVVPRLVDAASGLRVGEPQIPYISNVTADWVDAGQVRDPAYWGRHLRETVRFSQGLDLLLETHEDGVFLEVGPGNTLNSLLGMNAADNGRESTAIYTLRHPREKLSDGETSMRALAQLWLQGVAFDWQAFDAPGSRNHVELPTYPFQRQHFWVHAATDTGSERAAPVTRRPIPDWFYLPSWRRSMLPKKRASLAVDGRWLLFLDDTAFSRRARQWLQSASADVVCVYAGDQFIKADDGNYRIAPYSEDDYRLLVEDLQNTERLPDHVMHCWAVAPLLHEQADADRGSDDLLAFCYHSLIFFAKALGRTGSFAPVDITIMSHGAHAVLPHESPLPEKAALLGPCGVIGQEYPNLSCRNIEIEEPDADTVTIDPIMMDLVTPDDSRVVAYREGARWLRSYEPVKLDAAVVEDLPLRRGGVYLITGGLGGIGLVIAEYLAREYAANLVLTARTELPPREEWARLLDSGDGEDQSTVERIRAVNALEAHGSRVLVLSADAGDRDSMRTALQQARDTIGPINGVIHSAGVPGGCTIQLQTAATTEAVMYPKITGTRVLGELLEPLYPDFYVLCSSLAAVLGIPGQVDYCSANAFQDAYAEYYTAATGIPALSINWDTWNESGMAVNTRREMGEDASVLRQQGFNDEEGIEVFRRILGSVTGPRIAVSTFDLAMRMQKTAGAAEPETSEASSIEQVDSAVDTKPQYARPELKTAYAEPTTGEEKTISRLWGELLGIDNIGIDDDFFELGGHSLLATQIIARLRTVLSVELSLESIFEAPTVRLLSERIRAQKGDADEPADQAAELAQRIKQMTPEQRKQWLEQARRGKGAQR